jgi:hypothetical protein
MRREKVRRNPVPHVRRKRRAVHEHQWRAFAAYGVTHLSTVEVKDLIQ